jgi:hypothetical protein
MGDTEKTDTEKRDDIVQLLIQQGGVKGHHTALELANQIMQMVNGRAATAPGGPAQTLPHPVPAPLPEPDASPAK